MIHVNFINNELYAIDTDDENLSYKKILEFNEPIIFVSLNYKLKMINLFTKNSYCKYKIIYNTKEPNLNFRLFVVEKNNNIKYELNNRNIKKQGIINSIAELSCITNIKYFMFTGHETVTGITYGLHKNAIEDFFSTYFTEELANINAKNIDNLFFGQNYNFINTHGFTVSYVILFDIKKIYVKTIDKDLKTIKNNIIKYKQLCSYNNQNIMFEEINNTFNVICLITGDLFELENIGC